MEGNQWLLRIIHKMQSEIIKLEEENQALRSELQFSERKKAKQEEGAGESIQKEESLCLSSSGEGTTGCLVALCRSVSAGSALTLQEPKATNGNTQRNSFVPTFYTSYHCMNGLWTHHMGRAGHDPERPYPTGNIMTVRRYSTSSMPSFSSNKLHKCDKSNPFKGKPEIKGIIKPPAVTTDGQLLNKEDKELAKNQLDCLSNNAPNKKRDFQDQVFKCRGKVKAVGFLLPVGMSSYSGNHGSLRCLQNQNTKQLSTITEKDI